MSKKSHSPLELNDAGAEFLKTQQARMEALGRAQAEFVKQIESMQREMMEGWQNQADSARALCSDCAQNPTEAPKRYMDWLTAQFEHCMEQNRRLSNHWLNFMQSGMREFQQTEAGRKNETAATKVEHLRQAGGN